MWRWTIHIYIIHHSSKKAISFLRAPSDTRTPMLQTVPADVSSCACRPKHTRRARPDWVPTHTPYRTQWQTRRAWHDMTNRQHRSEMPFGTFWMVPLKSRVEEDHFSHDSKCLDVALRSRGRGLALSKWLWPHNGHFFRGIHSSESNTVTIMGRGF